MSLAPRAGVPAVRCVNGLRCQTSLSDGIERKSVSGVLSNRFVAHPICARDHALIDVVAIELTKGPFPARSFACITADTGAPPRRRRPARASREARKGHSERAAAGTANCQSSLASLPIRAELIGSDVCTAVGLVARGDAPVLELCPMLMNKTGIDPACPLHCYRDNVLVLTVRSIAEGARLKINGKGTGFIWAPPVGTASPVRQNARPLPNAPPLTFEPP